MKMPDDIGGKKQKETMEDEGCLTETDQTMLGEIYKDETKRKAKSKALEANQMRTEGFCTANLLSLRSSCFCESLSYEVRNELNEQNSYSKYAAESTSARLSRVF